MKREGLGVLDQALDRVRDARQNAEAGVWATVHVHDIDDILSALDTLEAESEQAKSNEDNLRAEAKFWGADADKWQARAERAEAALSDCMVALREAAWRFGYTATLMRKDPAMACLAPSMDEAADDARAVHTRLASSTLCRVEGEGVG